MSARADAAEPAPGIHRLALPTPFLVGRVNCYLIEEDPLTLVDTGPSSGKTLDELDQALRALGHTIAELGLIVLTHQHVDHCGLLEILPRRSGAEVAALDLLAGYLRAYPDSAAADDVFAQEVMRSHGVPTDTVTVLGTVSAAFRAYGSAGNVDRVLRDGEVLSVGPRRLTVQHRPGHSPTDTLFLEESTGVMIGGDHLLGTISSNPLITRPPDADPAAPPAERPRALITYLESLRATRELPLSVVLPGHGDPVRDHVSLIDERLRMHERRAAKILRMLGDGPLSAYEVALRMWGNVAITQAYLAISEVVGHLDLLVRDGLAEEISRDGVFRFRATGTAGAAGAAGPATPPVGAAEAPRQVDAPDQG